MTVSMMMRVYLALTPVFVGKGRGIFITALVVRNFNDLKLFYIPGDRRLSDFETGLQQKCSQLLLRFDILIFNDF